MDRGRFERIKDIITLILAVVFFGATAVGLVRYGGLPIGETPTWVLWCLTVFIMWGMMRRDG